MKATDRAYIKKIPKKLRHFVNFIQKKYPRPDQLPEIFSEKIRKFRTCIAWLWPLSDIYLDINISKRSLTTLCIDLPNSTRDNY